LAHALSARRIGPSLFVGADAQRDRHEGSLVPGEVGERAAALRIAAMVLDDDLEEALRAPASGPEAEIWQAVALRRAGRFSEARQAFRAAGEGPEHPRLFERALRVFGTGGGGFRWAAESAAHLRARGRWDPVWFVDACESAYNGLISSESAALLEEIQRAELQLLLEAGAAG